MPSSVSQKKTHPVVDLILSVAWLSCVSATLWFAVQTSGRLPKFDEWVEMVPAISGNQPITLTWLWSQLNEHRIPLPRLAYLGAYYVSGGDFRSGACLSVVLLSLTALLCMAFARRCRGSSLADAFFPLILLHWGQAHNFLLGITLNFVIPTVLGYLALLLVLSPKPFTVRRGLLWTLCLLGMPLCGLTGVVLALPLACWLAALGLSRLRAPGPSRRQGLAFLLMAMGVLAVLRMYFVDFSWPGRAPDLETVVAHQGLRGRLEAMDQILTMSLGWLGWAGWPLAGGLLLLLAVAATLAVAVAYCRWPELRLQTSGWLAFMASTVLLVAGVGWGRSFFVGEELWSTTRYATVSIPVLVGIYFASLVTFSPTVGNWTRALLGVTALIVYGGHVVGGQGYPYCLQWARAVRCGEEDFICAAVNNATSERLAQIGSAWQYAHDPRGVRCVEMLRSAGLGPFGLPERKRRRYAWRTHLNRGDPALSLGDRAAQGILESGWSANQDWGGRWTVGPLAVLRFGTEPTADCRLTVRLVPFVVPGRVDRQRVRVLLNGTEVQTLLLDRAEWTDQTILLPEPLLGPVNILTFQLPDAVSPKQVSVNSDERMLGVCVQTLRLD